MIKTNYKTFFKKLVILFALVQLAACATSAHVYDKKTSLAGVVENCSTHHIQGNGQDNVSFSVIDASNIDYYIIVSGTDLSSNRVDRYCHIDKSTHSLLYANGQEVYLSDLIDSTEYQNRYEGVLSGDIALGQVSISQYKMITGQWRHIGFKELQLL